MQFAYTNHRGDRERREVTLIAILFVTGEQLQAHGHMAAYNPGVFLECIAHDRENAVRWFAVDHIDWGIEQGRVVADVSDPNLFELLTNPDFKAGNAAARHEEPFNFDGSAAWARGYNEGRRYLLRS